jgi:radical SAM protein with 4Fe4S-binding SPASM domain
VEISINTQINRVSFEDTDAIFELCAAGGFHSWQVQLTVPMGRAVEHADWLLQPDDLLDVVPRLARFAREGPARGVRLWPGNNVGYFGPHEDDLRGSLVAGAHYSGCTAGSRTLGIEADGAIKGCPSLPSAAYTGGNVRERTVRAIWEGSAELRFARDRTVPLWGGCQRCYYADVCRGGCTWTAHVFFGRAGNNPYCHHRALELDRRGLRERLELRARAPQEPFDHGLFALIEDAARSSDERAADRAAARGRALARSRRRQLSVTGSVAD